MQTNPFKPTAGKTPPTIIGREDVLEEFNEGLVNGPGAPGRLMRIAGVRGTGKTVLLDECSRLAQSRGWTVIKEVATEGLCQRILEQLQPKFQAKHARFEPTVAGISIGSIDIERIGPSLRDAMRQTISKNGNGLLITLDEVQDAELDEVRTLSIAIQQVIGEDLDIAFVFAGLPSMIESIINGKTLTFLRRALPFDLKAVAVTEVSYSLEETIEASGMELQPGIAGQLAEATQGYPFMIQLVGYYAWQLARRAHTAIIGEEEAERGIATARERFCGMVIEPALQRIPPTCIAYLLSMASLGQTSSTSMVADALNKTPQQVSSVRSRLLRENRLSRLLRTARSHLPSPTCATTSANTKPNWKLNCRNGNCPARRNPFSYGFKADVNGFRLDLRPKLRRKLRFRTLITRRKLFSSGYASPIQTKRAPSSY